MGIIPNSNTSVNQDRISRNIVQEGELSIDRSSQGFEAVGNSHSALPTLWAGFLDNPAWEWCWYGHFTFRDVDGPFCTNKHQISQESACKVWDKWIHNLNRESYGVKYWKHPDKSVVWARGSELQHRGSLHFHALIGKVPDRVRRMDYLDRWFDLAGIARIYSYEKGKGAESYMSKSSYAWKRGEIDLGGPLAYHLGHPQVEMSF